MTSAITVSKIINEVSFRINNNEYKRATDRIKKIAGLFNKSTNQYTKSMEQGRRAAGMQAKASDKATRAEIRASRTRKQTLKADQIKYRDQIKSNAEFQKGLQKINMQFLHGTIGFKERSASIGALNKQYKTLNSEASKHNNIVRKIGGKVVGSALGTAATGAGIMGASGYAATRGFDSVKAGGQQFEALNVSLDNTFGAQATAVSDIISKLAYESGREIVDTGNQLVNYVSIVKSLGIETNKAISLFEKQSNMTSSYGMSGDQVAGFQYGLMQTMSSNTLEDFRQAMDWSPQIKGDLLKFVKDSMGLSQKEFMGNLTNGKFNFKDIWLKFVEATAPKYAQMSQGYKRSSMANDARASNSVAVAVYRIFESSGFQTAMESASRIIGYWGNLLETNAGKIGDVFGNLYGITEDLSKQGFQELSDWLKALTKEDIQGYFGDLKNSMMQFADVMRRLFAFLDSVLPKQTISDQKGQYYIQREKYWLDQGYSGQEAGRFADGEMRKQFNLGFTVPTLENSLVRMSARNQTTNHQATLDLKINTEVNQPKLDQYVWATIQENDNRHFNLAFSY